MRIFIYLFSAILFLQLLVSGSGNAVKRPRIHNGNDAHPNRIRWMAWITRNGAFVCGGALLTTKYVITAAQCVDRAGSYHVVLGDYDRGSIDGDEQMIKVANIHLNPDWNRMRLENDIALLELETRANMSSTTVSKIQIRQISNSTVDQMTVTDDSIKCVMAGWGYTTYEGVWMLSPLLQTLEIKLQNDTRCSEILMGAYDPATKLCFENVDSGACSGDNGGPWMCMIDTRWTIVGIHSYGVMHDGCRAGGRAGTRVSYFYDWILSIVKNNWDDDDEVV